MTPVSTRCPRALPMACDSQAQVGQIQGPSRGSPAIKVSPQAPLTLELPNPPSPTNRPREEPHPFAWRLCRGRDSDAGGGGTRSCGADVPAPDTARGLGMGFLLLVGTGSILSPPEDSGTVRGKLFPATELSFPSGKPSPSSFQRAQDRCREQAGGGRDLILQSHLPLSPVLTASQIWEQGQRICLCCEDTTQGDTSL